MIPAVVMFTIFNEGYRYSVVNQWEYYWLIRCQSQVNMVITQFSGAKNSGLSDVDQIQIALNIVQ